MYDVCVDNGVNASLILLTYKGKMLLMYRSNHPAVLAQKIWCLIGGQKEKNESFEEAIFRKVEREISIKLAKIEFLSSFLYGNKTEYLYHAILTDDNVNNIKRGDGQYLEFFTLQELGKLTLTASARLFTSKYKNLFEKNLSN